MDYECVQCDWQGLVDELEFPEIEGEGVCPECGSPVEAIEE